MWGVIDGNTRANSYSSKSMVLIEINGQDRPRTRDVPHFKGPKPTIKPTEQWEGRGDSDRER